jgi:uncharacterized protein YbaA (DUF1428 family)
MGTERKEIGEGSIGSEVDHFIYRVPKKNHDAMVQINKQFADMITKYGATHLVFQLNNTKTPMDGMANIAKTIAAADDEEVWLELIFYRDRKHKDEIGTKMRNDESMGPLYQQSLDLVTPGTGFILGEFTRLMI